MIRATYRLQMRNGVGFREAARLVPHLARAGLSHLYLSPIFAARSGSTHGYDVIDHGVLDPVLGSEADFDGLVETLHRHGMGLILDLVPNHMAASAENPWWRDVLRHGPASRTAHHFDIDWSQTLVLPILGKPYGAALRDGDITRGDHPEWGPVLSVPGHDLPLAPGTETIRDIHALHEAQHYRVAHWRLGRDGLTYRRFFEIADLVGVRVEDDTVFEDVHRHVARLVDEGKVQAVRIDHVDGLADPSAYLDRVSRRLGVPVFVEKILEDDEALPQWPVEGTTGYEFLAGLSALLASSEGRGELARQYAAVAEDDVVHLTGIAKRRIVSRHLVAEVRGLTDCARTLLARNLATRDWGPETVREAIEAVLCAFPVYRTYVDAEAERIGTRDAAVLETARRGAHARDLEDATVVDDCLALLDPLKDTGVAAAGQGGSSPTRDPVRSAFLTRFQQTTGPVMAKAVEDTLFYRHHRLLALNEVGGGPDMALGSERFLKAARGGGLAPTATHDTKRGADARARLLALCDPDAAGLWDGTWRQMPGDVPERLRWAMAQMLFASAPLRPDPAFSDRFREAVLKTVREAKEETSWTRRDEAFEARVAHAAEAMAAARDRLAPLAPVARAGAVLGLSQALLATVCRPAPDIYQGGFSWDLSMVDPDNRRPVDFAGEGALCAFARTTPIGALAADWENGAVKARVLLEGLAARAERPALFSTGALTRAPLSGSAAEAFFALSRADGDNDAIIVVARRPLPFLKRQGLSLDVASLTVESARPLRERMSGSWFAPGATDLAAALSESPVILLTSW